jgi:hypothetical protein
MELRMCARGPFVSCYVYAIRREMKKKTNCLGPCNGSPGPIWATIGSSLD